MWCRAIRGAITVEENTRQAILGATQELLAQLVAANDLQPEDVISAFFTTTPDVNAAFPATAARLMGWENVALMCAHEMNVPGALPKCIRVMIHVNSTKQASEVVNLYLRGAEHLKQMALSLGTQ